MDDAESESLEDIVGNFSNLMRKRLEKVEEREQAFERQKKAFEQANPSLGSPGDVLRLNVGGTRIDVLRRTLTSIEGSMLAAKFSGRWDDSLEKDADGNFFIDQPIELFLPMVNYLRAEACMTPGAPPVQSPFCLLDELKRDDFFRMLEYYGMTLGIYPYGIYKSQDNSSNVPPISGHPDYKVEAEHQWTTFYLLQKPGNENTCVTSYEAILGKSTSAQIGWIPSGTNIPNEDGNGVGYANNSVALDSNRSGIALGKVSSHTAAFYSIASIPTMEEGTTIRCENNGAKWYVNGTFIASANESDETATYIPGIRGLACNVPCFSVKGSLRISKIKISF